MSTDGSVRAASVDDVTAIQHVARATWHAAYDEVLGPSAVDEQVDECYRDDVLAEAIESEEVIYLVVDDGEDLIGYASAGPSEQFEDCQDEEVAQLYTIYVAPEYWGDGIGSRLVDEVVDRLRNDGYDALRICVLAANDVGRAFYESYGFPVIEEGTTTIADEAVEEVVYTGTL
jgi:ribosomal protein S18 acetylase RimI-like enzyme